MQVVRYNRWALLAAMMMAWMGTGIAAEKKDTAAKPKTEINARATYNAVCAVCHGKNGWGKTVGSNRFPAIAGLPKWYLEDQLIMFKYDGRGADHQDREGLMMHAMVRTLRKRTMVIKKGLDEFEFEHDIVKIADYVNKLTPSQTPRPTWTPTPEQIENGKKIYNAEGVLGCKRCHGDKFEGLKRENKNIPRAPSLGVLDDWYMLSQLKKFRNGVRGNPAKTAVGGNLEGEKKEFARRYKDAVGEDGRKETIPGIPQMQAMSLTAFAIQKDQEQAMRDVVAFIYKAARESQKEKK